MKKIALLLVGAFALLSACGDGGSNTPDDAQETDNAVTVDTVIPDTTADQLAADDAAAPKDDTAVVDTATDAAAGDELITDTDVVVDPLAEAKKKFVGTWAERLILKAKTVTTGVSAESTTTRYKIGKITYNEAKGELEITHQICKIDSESSIGAPIFPQKYCDIYHFWRSNELKSPVEDITIIKNNDNSLSFIENWTWELRGMEKMTAVETDAMPKAKTDARIIDHDSDGNPGFTMSVGGLGKFYFVQRLSQKLTGKAVTEKRAEGGVEWTDEQYIIDADNITLKGQRTTTTHNDQSTFVYVKVDDTITCEQLYAQKDTLFK